MNLDIRREGLTYVVALGGDVVGADGLRLREEFTKIAEQGGEDLRVLIDCRGCRVVDSVGQGALVYGHAQLVRKSEARVALINVGALLEALLGHANLLDQFERFPHADTADHHVETREPRGSGPLACPAEP